MITNILATIVVTLVTNTVDHWPQKLEYIPGVTIDYAATHPYEPWSMSIPVSINDTNADTKTVETTVTAEKSISTDLPGIRFRNVLTNWNVLHYSVEMQRVRVWVWGTILAIDDFSSARTFSLSNLNNSQFRVLNDFKAPHYTLQQFTETNYFVPFKTNSLPLVEEPLARSGTNAFGYWELRSLTNFSILTNAPAITNIIYK